MQSLSSSTKSSSSSSSSSESDDVEVRAVYTEEKILPERVPMRPSRGGLSKTRRLKQKIKELKAKIHTLKDAHRLEMKFMADALLNTKRIISVVVSYMLWERKICEQDNFFIVMILHLRA